ncbi:cytochrome P450 [Streptomyces sp. ISL-1]|uniref:cytochrome P450 family protein n=1 Tax=Streptomyces sp. ISL-1 TaxID=2817657 RepID=UPI001BECF733|nr:cytochrome P450 [Streptomyces sp. ISL-1]MBT2388990.1 cytochrome P450 [Streptomyces sp. ISL-1]
MDLSHPLFTLDPFAADARAEAKRLLEAGPVVPVDVVGVPVWAVTRHAVAQQIFEDPSFSMNSSNFGALQRGEVPAGWPLMKIITAQYMGTADGTEHRRLRNLVSPAFTARRVEALRPQIQRIVDDLLERLAAAPAHEATDLKEAFAVPLPMGVICELFGVPDEQHAPLHSLCQALFDSTEQPTEVTATEEALYRFMAELAASKAADPGDDLTSVLVEQHTSGSITHDELVGTLILVLTAGHHTTINFFTNSLLALMTHPEQLARVRAGEVSWHSVTESVLAWDSPVNQGAFRYPARDIELGGVLIRAGEPIMMSYVSLGHDPAQHGPLATSFDVARDTRHLSFGHGPHFCVGAPLARLEAHIALPAFFDRFDAELAVPRDEVEPFHSLALNGVRAVPAIIRPRQEAVAGG